MRLITSLLILWLCWSLTMEEPQPTPYSYLYSDVDACTRYNFLPINAKNFREAILFFNLCTQLLRLLPEDQRKDYARYLKHEIIMTRNEFNSKNDKSDVTDWLDSKTDFLIRELSKIQPNSRRRNERIGLSWPLLPLGRMNYRKKSDTKIESTSRHTSGTTIQADEADRTPTYQDYGGVDQENNSLSEEKINVNDIAMIGLILGLVSTVSGALTLLYIFYCGTKGAKKKVITDNHQKRGTDSDREKLIQQRSRSAMESQMSTKIAKYASGECKVNESDGLLSQYQSFDKSPTKNGEQDYENPVRDELNMAIEYTKHNNLIIPNYNQVSEHLGWNLETLPAADKPVYPVYIENTQGVYAPMTVHHLSELGYPVNTQQFGPAPIKDQSQLEYYTMATNQLSQHKKSKDGYGDSDEPKNILNRLSQQKIGLGMPADKKETQNYSFSSEEKKQSQPFSYIQQKYTKSQPLMNSHFPCDVRQQQSAQKFQQRPTPSALQSMLSHQERQQSQLQDPKMTKDSGNTVADGEKGRPPTSDFVTLRNEGTRIDECENCKKRIQTPEERQGLTCENVSALMRMRMEASKKESGLEKTPAPCNMTDSENIMQQEKFLCSLSASTPLTTKEQYVIPDDKILTTQETHQRYGTTSEKKSDQPAENDQNSDVQNYRNKNLTTSTDLHLPEADTHITTEQKLDKSFQTHVVTKCHKLKSKHLKTPLCTHLPPKKLQRSPMQQIDSSYFSMKPGSPYQSCAEVSPVQTSKLDRSAVDATDNAFVSKPKQKDLQKTIKTMFCRDKSNARDSNESEKLIRR